MAYMSYKVAPRAVLLEEEERLARSREETIPGSGRVCGPCSFLCATPGAPYKGEPRGQVVAHCHYARHGCCTVGDVPTGVLSALCTRHKAHCGRVTGRTVATLSMGGLSAVLSPRPLLLSSGEMVSGAGTSGVPMPV